MKERPILFSAPMVRALLGGTKTQTRRVVKLPIEQDAGWSGGWKIVHKAVTLAIETYNRMMGKAVGKDPVICPYGQPGDRLWVRETYQPLWAEGIERESTTNWKTGAGYRVSYPATDGVQEFMDADDNLRTSCKPSIHMPRWASRILLEVVSVRVERLNTISAGDCRAEGIGQCDGLGSNAEILDLARRMGPHQDAVLRYATLWEQLNGAGSWGANPWVWVVEFKRVTP